MKGFSVISTVNDCLMIMVKDGYTTTWRYSFNHLWECKHFGKLNEAILFALKCMESDISQRTQ